MLDIGESEIGEMSTQFRNLELGGTQEMDHSGTPERSLLANIPDEDLGRSNPLLGFLIALPIGLALWAVPATILMFF